VWSFCASASAVAALAAVAPTAAEAGASGAWPFAQGDGSGAGDFAVGRDDVLRQELTLLAAGRPLPAPVLGWTDRIPHLLMTHHVVISKAGGATTQEAIAARCPMIVNQIVPGQEEGNYELLRRTGAGALAETPAAVINTLRAAFADRGAQWRQWRTALEPIVRNSAAQVIASHLLTVAPASGKRSALNVAIPPIPAAALP
jgi:processive 1,2-diacylglycerol beta-glucosyltransferase